MLVKCLLLLLVVTLHQLSVAEAEGGPGGCGPLPLVNHTKPIEGQAFSEQTRLRYSCEAGFVRKAGTSNLYKCVKDQAYHWRNEPKLECIPDPKLPPAVPKAPEQTPTTIKASTESSVAPVENTTTSTTTATTATATVPSSAAPSETQHTTHTSLASDAVPITTSKSITFGTTTATVITTATTTTTSKTATEEETTGVSVKLPSTSSPLQPSPSPSQSSALATPKPQPVFNEQAVVVSGSVVGVILLVLMFVVLLVLYTKQMLPCLRRQHRFSPVTPREETQEEDIPMEEQNNDTA